MSNPFAAQFAVLSGQLAEGEGEAVTKAVAALVVDETAMPESAARLAQLRSAIDKLSRRAGGETAAVLQEAGAQVQAAQRALRYKARDEAQDRAAATVRGRVLELLGVRGPLRPLDLARELDVDPSQVSRALAELRSQGCVQQTREAPLGDGRGRWYELDPPTRFRDKVMAALLDEDWTEVRLVGKGTVKVIKASEEPSVAEARPVEAAPVQRVGPPR